MYRIPRGLNGERENDLEHCGRLAYVCEELIDALYPHLDKATVISMALNHEWPEALVGDTLTYAISDRAYADKKARETVAADAISELLPASARRRFMAYEEADSPEARFVCAVDKLMPSLLNIHGQGSRVLREDCGVATIEQFDTNAVANHQKYRQRFGDEFPELVALHKELGDIFREQFYDAISTVERTFLVDPRDLMRRLGKLETHPSFWRSQQGFIIGGLAVQQLVQRNGDPHYTLLARGATTLIGEDEFREYWPATAGRRLQSHGVTYDFNDTRHTPYTAGLTVYSDELEGLATATMRYVDRPGPGTTFRPPAWLGKEITGDTAYMPEALAGQHYAALSKTALNGFALAYA